MKVVSKYIAEDGKVFDSIKECQDYEDGLRLKDFEKIRNIKFFDVNGNLFENVESTLFHVYTNFYKVIIPTKEDCEALKELFSKEGCYLGEISSEGSWYRITDMYEENYEIISEKRYKEIVEAMQHLIIAK